MARLTFVVRLFLMVVFSALGLQACSKAAPTTAQAPAKQYGDISLTTCRQDPLDHTSIDAAGSIKSQYRMPYDYSFYVEAYDGAVPAGGSGVSEHPVEPGADLPWSTQFVIAGATSGSFTCQLRSILRTPSQSS